MPTIADRFLQARGDPAAAVLEGFHPVKHALRFGAEVLSAITPDPAAVLELTGALAPDLASRLAALLTEIPAELFHRSAPSPPPTPLLAVAARPVADPAAALAERGPAPIVFLDHPNHLGNLGAAVRVAAAAGAAAVLTSGERDPWHPTALRGSAGLHFALPVARTEVLDPGDRPLVAVDPAGPSLWETPLPARAVLAFGGERGGLGEGLRRAADLVVGIPMRPGVSSLNLATAVAVVLFAGGGTRRDVRPCRGPGDAP